MTNFRFKQQARKDEREKNVLDRWAVDSQKFLSTPPAIPLALREFDSERSANIYANIAIQKANGHLVKLKNLQGAAKNLCVVRVKNGLSIKSS